MKGNALDYRSLRTKNRQDVRQAIRSGSYRGHTAGLADGYLQANLIILPKIYALDFMRFCQRNPKPCPLVGVSDDGDPYLRTCGQDIDIRHDLPSYNIYRNGALSEQLHAIEALWSEELVTFALGCSFTFEHAMERQGIPVRNIRNNTTVPMYRSSLPTVQAGPFRGPVVVSMRPVAQNQVHKAAAISAHYPLAHGSPMHWGNPQTIGIGDIDKPDWGERSPIGRDEVPVFWACGVTPQAAVQAAKIPFCISHTPGCMLITDIPETAEVPVLMPEPVEGVRP